MRHREGTEYNDMAIAITETSTEVVQGRVAVRYLDRPDVDGVLPVVFPPAWQYLINA